MGFSCSTQTVCNPLKVNQICWFFVELTGICCSNWEVVVVETYTDPAYPKGCKAFNKSVGKCVRRETRGEYQSGGGQVQVNNSRGSTPKTPQSIVLGANSIIVALVDRVVLYSRSQKLGISEHSSSFPANLLRTYKPNMANFVSCQLIFFYLLLLIMEWNA
ncbi:hypothetical protein AVEN_190605-1 [Araneus ventricosus]|uniref:Uncharacterized protein n=1 Tax=Araneus ventricosus TaxID=182803 RepID=A0A4Y2CE89_ARAVE|nr:hypothetical protein AVEN_190605-1 [Araneus ventricosus]